MPTERSIRPGALLGLLAGGLGLVACGSGLGAGSADGRFDAPGRAARVEMPADARLRLIGAVALGVPAAGFGGFSGLEVSADGARLIAISDRGAWLEARIARAGGPDRPPAGLEAARLTPLLALSRSGESAPPAPVWRDAEGLATFGPDLAPPAYVSFEQVHRIDRFAGLDAAAEPFVRLHGLGAADGPEAEPPSGNSGFEALAAAPDGRLLAIREIWGEAAEDARWIAPDGTVAAAALPREGTAPAVGADFAPDGALWLLRRRFELLGGFSFAVIRHLPTATGFGPGEVMLDLPFGDAVDNAEGLAVWVTPAGRTRIMLISDDNFLPLQRTILYEFELRPESRRSPPD